MAGISIAVLLTGFCSSMCWEYVAERNILVILTLRVFFPKVEKRRGLEVFT